MSGDASESRIGVAVEALGLTIGGVATGVVAAFGIGFLVFELAGGELSDALLLFQARYLQVGFGLFALGYVVARATPSRYVRIRRPTRRDVGWTVAIPAALVLTGALFDSLLAAFGLPLASGAAEGLPVDVAGRPDLWPVLFVAWFLIAAPAEELLFRGVVQGRIREAFDATRGVLLAASLFAFAHVLLGVVTGRGTGAIAANAVETFAGGLAFGVGYERTDNLAVPAVAHAGLWTLGLALA